MREFGRQYLIPFLTDLDNLISRVYYLATLHGLVQSFFIPDISPNEYRLTDCSFLLVQSEDLFKSTLVDLLE
jgi:hypothetical protein